MNVKKSLIKLIFWPTTSILSISLPFVFLSCAKKDKGSHDIALSWENNQNILDGNNNNKCVAILNASIVNGTPEIVNWDVASLPNGIAKDVSENSITFVLDQTYSYGGQSIKIKASCSHGDYETTTLKIQSYTAVQYGYTINLSQYSSDFDYNANKQTGGTPVSVSSTISDSTNSTTTHKANWSWSNIPNYIIVNPASSPTETNTIEFKIDDSTKYVTAHEYIFTVSYNDGSTDPSHSAANKYFVLKAKSYEFWDPTWIPKEFLNFSGTTLLGLKNGVDISPAQYTTLHIPTTTIKIANSAFKKIVNNDSDTTLTDNIKYLDFSSSVSLQSIGSGSFYKAPIEGSSTTKQNELCLPSSLTAEGIGSWAFYHSKIKGLDISNCNLLKKLFPATFAWCENLENIKFNDNLEELVDSGGAGIGAFEMFSSNFSGSLKLPNHIRKIGSGAFSGLGNRSNNKTFSINWNNCFQLSSIESNAFANVALDPNTTLEIPNCVSYLGLRCFYLINENLIKVVIPASVTTIAANCFIQCNKLMVVRISDNGNPHLKYLTDEYPTNEGANGNFQKWLRNTPLEPGPEPYGNSSQSGAQVELPKKNGSNNYDPWYDSNWPSWITKVAY